MALCSRCNATLSLSEKIAGPKGLCKRCVEEIKKEKEIEKTRLIQEKENQKDNLIQEILVSYNINDDQLYYLRDLSKENQIEIYNAIKAEYDSDNELDIKEITVLIELIQNLSFSYEDVNFLNTVYPYFFVACIRETDNLPETEYKIEPGLSQLLLKKGEKYHYGYAASLIETKMVNLGYQGGSAGVSIPVMKGVRFRVGNTRGHIKKTEKKVETSRGLLSVTSKRLILTPLQGYKPLAIPLNKILSYSCYSNGIEIYKEGREKGYFFSVPSSGAVEIMGICLNHIMSQ